MRVKELRRILLAVLVLHFALPSYADSPSAKKLFSLAEQQYDAEDYQTAAEFLQLAIKADPRNAKYHHLLGKSYGRLAEQSNWLSAIELSQKTLKELEKAVELDDKNIPAMSDLIKFYRQAPSFLGGDQEKANTLAEKIEYLRAQTNYSPSSSENN